MRTALWLGMTVAVTCLISGCGEVASDASDPPSDANLDGRTFVGADVTRQGDDYPLVKGSAITVSFGTNDVGASAGCNHMSGGAAWDAGALEVSDGLAMTEMGCESPLMEQDKWFSDFLQSSPQLTLDNKVLTLSDSGTVVTLRETTPS